MTNKFLVKFAETQSELQQAFKLRYDDLVLEYSSGADNQKQMDYSPCDDYAKHVIVVQQDTNEVVGYYRLLLGNFLPKDGRFVCEKEYDLDTFKSIVGASCICELSRAVVKKQCRGGVLILLLWKFILNYMYDNGYRFLVGDASFFGTDRDAYANEISYLTTNYPAEPKYAIATRDTLPPMQMKDASEYDVEQTARNLPPLIKGYVNMGATIASQPFVDVPFGSTDVFVLFDAQNCNDEYVNKIRNH